MDPKKFFAKGPSKAAERDVTSVGGLAGAYLAFLGGILPSGCISKAIEFDRTGSLQRGMLSTWAREIGIHLGADGWNSARDQKTLEGYGSVWQFPTTEKKVPYVEAAPSPAKPKAAKSLSRYQETERRVTERAPELAREAVPADYDHSPMIGEAAWPEL